MYGTPGLKPWQGTKWTPPVRRPYITRKNDVTGSLRVQGYSSRHAIMGDEKTEARNMTEHREQALTRNDNSEETMRDAAPPTMRQKETPIVKSV